MALSWLISSITPMNQDLYKEAKAFNLTLRCVDEVLSINNQNLLIIIHPYILAVFI